MISEFCRDDTTAAGGVGPAGEVLTVMDSDDTTASGRPGRHTARKNTARELATRTGMPYTAALRQVQQAAEPRQPRYRWVLTDEVRAWFAGESWRGVGYPNLYDWLDEEVNPAYECDWCAEPGDAREDDSSIRLVITAYDPDLAPATMHLATSKYHATCQPSSISWVHKVDISTGPQRIGLPASMRPEVAGEFELEARALLNPGQDDEPEHAVLLVTARVIEDHQQGARAWLSELELHLSSEGFGHPESLALGDGTTWSLRIVTGGSSSFARQWIALRTGADEQGVLQHLFVQALDLPEVWVAAARRDGQVVVVFGPCTDHWDVAPVPAEFMDELDELADERAVEAAGSPDRCACAALTAGQIEDLVYAGVFVVGPVPVVPSNEEG